MRSSKDAVRIPVVAPCDVRVVDEELEDFGGVRFRRPCCRRRSAHVGLDSSLLVALDLLDVLFPVRREAKFFFVAPEDGGAGTNAGRATEDGGVIWDLIQVFD